MAEDYPQGKEAYLERQQQAAALEAERQRLNNAILAAIVETAPTAVTDKRPWVRPTGVQNAFAQGSVVTHNGKTWESLTPFNVWEPGVSGWREQVTTGYPSWVQPTGAHDAYSFDDKVSHKNKNWKSTVTGTRTNTWEPGVYGWVETP